MILRAYLTSRQKMVDRALDRFLPKANVKPLTIHQAMVAMCVVGCGSSI